VAEVVRRMGAVGEPAEVQSGGARVAGACRRRSGDPDDARLHARIARRTSSRPGSRLGLHLRSTRERRITARMQGDAVSVGQSRFGPRDIASGVVGSDVYPGFPVRARGGRHSSSIRPLMM
jgi:hypothetical protein